MTHLKSALTYTYNNFLQRSGTVCDIRHYLPSTKDRCRATDSYLQINLKWKYVLGYTKATSYIVNAMYVSCDILLPRLQGFAEVKL